jgi:hypothetical protein
MDNSANITKLILEFEQLKHDGNMDFASKAVINVGRVDDDNGGYNVYLVAVRKEEDASIKILKCL